MKYYKKMYGGFILWVAQSETTLDDAIEISKEEYDELTFNELNED